MANGPLYTDYEITYIKENYGKTPTKEMAEHLGRPLGGMQVKAEQLGLKAFPEHVEFICANCGLTMMTSPSFKRKRKYCSWECYLIAHKAKPKPKKKPKKSGPKPQAIIPKPCEYCGKLISIKGKKLKAYSKQRFCSYSCARKTGWDGKRAKRIERICKNCDKVFHVTEASLTHHKAIYCSVQCANEDLFKGQPKSEEHNRKNSEAHLENPPTWSKFQNTSIEVALQDELTERGVSFETHIAIEKICRPDIVFPGIKLAVQADGDYWHNRPGAQEHDKESDKQLKEIGWTVLRFWGSEIRADVKACVDKIELESYILNHSSNRANTDF